MSTAAAWEPARNAVHRLLQLIDVLAIALNRFRQLSFKLPPYSNPQFHSERERLQADYHGVTRAIFPTADIAPQYTAARIANLAVAELARAGSKDEQAVRDAQAWLADTGWILVPCAAPQAPESPLWERFMREGQALTQYNPVRQQLFATLARVGQTVPDEIVRRDRLASCPLMHEGEEPIPQDVLLRLVRETEMSSDSSKPAGAGTGDPSAAACGVAGDSLNADGAGFPTHMLRHPPAAG